MESGHSYLPNDRDFGAIEKKGKSKPFIYCFDQWIDVIEESRNKNKFRPINTSTKFKKFSEMEHSRNRFARDALSKVFIAQMQEDSEPESCYEHFRQCISSKSVFTLFHFRKLWRGIKQFMNWSTEKCKRIMNLKAAMNTLDKASRAISWISCKIK